MNCIVHGVAKSRTRVSNLKKKKKYYCAIDVVTEILNPYGGPQVRVNNCILEID